MTDLTKITSLTERLGISSRSLRYYEQVGLIRSVRPGDEKYRYFDAENIERLKQIQVLRKMQIPIKDIIRIYESKDASVVVETFVRRLGEIDVELNTLSELKRIVSEFLQTMMKYGIKQITALPLLYEEMEKQLAVVEDNKPISYSELDAVSERLTKAPEVRVVLLPPMRALSSLSETGESDTEAFWNWLNLRGIAINAPGSHSLLEYQDSSGQSVLLSQIDADFENDGPFSEYEFAGGLFAAASVYADDDIGAFCRAIIRRFDENPFYTVDYRGGGLRHDILVETVISPDSKRELLDIFVPLKKRLPNAALYEPFEHVENAVPDEVFAANPALRTIDVPLDKLTPIYSPQYRVNDDGEAEYIATISTRMLGTGVEVSIPFRVDIEFRVDESGAGFGYGADEGSIRIYHGVTFTGDNPEMPMTGDMYAVNMGNSPDPRLSQEALEFNQPVLSGWYSYPKLGKIEPNVYNTLTWIVGEKHFAVILNGEVRFCGVRFPYMSMDVRQFEKRQIVVGSAGQGKRYFRKISVSQLKHSRKNSIRKGELTMQIKQSSNILPNIHNLITSHFGENYWFNGAARYVMECLSPAPEAEKPTPVPAINTGIWPLPAGAYDPALGECGVPDGAHIYGLFNEGYAKLYEPEVEPELTEVPSLSELTANSYCVLHTSSGFDYVAVMSDIPVTVTGRYAESGAGAVIGGEILDSMGVYDLFAGITGDFFAQIYPLDGRFRGDSSTDYRWGVGNYLFVEEVFDKVGYAASFVSSKQLRTNREMYRQLLIAYIDKGVPVINCPYYDKGDWGCYVGYEENGNVLLYLSGDSAEPIRKTFDEVFAVTAIDRNSDWGWLFVGEKTHDVDLKQLYREVVLGLPELLTTKTDVYVFGADAFRVWANEIESGRFDKVTPEEFAEGFNGWQMYKNYVCNFATNSGCCRMFLEKAQELNPDLTFLEDVGRQYHITELLWNGSENSRQADIDGWNGVSMESLGAGFNITLEVLQDPKKRSKIADTLRSFAACIDEVVRLITVWRETEGDDKH